MTHKGAYMAMRPARPHDCDQWLLVIVNIVYHIRDVADCRPVSQCSPCRNVPRNSPSGNEDQDFSDRDFRDEFDYECDPCDCPSTADMTHGFSRRPSRRTTSAPPCRKPRVRRASPMNFECGFLRRKSDCNCECLEPVARPPFVIRRV